MQDTANQRRLLLTVDEAAAVLRIAPATLYKHVARGTSPLTPKRIGRRLLFSAAEIERYANDGDGAMHTETTR